jgi:hypothetical protein
VDELMLSPDLALQKAIGARLATSPAVLALVPSEAILDRGTRPERFPCVVIGECQTVLESLTYGRRHIRVFHTLHVWSRETGTIGAKAIAGAIRDALKQELLIDDHRVVDHLVPSVRVLRGEGGDLSHAVVTAETLVEERL